MVLETNKSDLYRVQTRLVLLFRSRTFQKFLESINNFLRYLAIKQKKIVLELPHCQNYLTLPYLLECIPMIHNFQIKLENKCRIFSN